MITLDSSALFALLAHDEPEHELCVVTLSAARPPFLVPAGILGEIGYMIETWLGAHALDTFLGNLEAGSFTLHCGDTDFARIRELVERYGDLRLGFADASVVACAEGHAGTVMTLDRGDFDVVAREGTIHVVPELA